MNAWDHLPNAAHIDRILASVKLYPTLWHQAMDQVWDQARDQAWDQAMDQVWDQARDQAWDQAWDQVWPPVLALIAYDDSAKYLELSAHQLQMLHLLNEHPACLLLQPAVLVFAMERELALG